MTRKIKFPNNKIFNAIPWTPDDEEERCPDCNCKDGESHHDGCDIEQCAQCGEQAMSCECWL